jgi:hypothetical protein
MTKKAYSGLLMNELFLMEDYGIFLPHRAFEEATGETPESDAFLQVIINESVTLTYKGKEGRRWMDFFWEGELKPNTYLELMQEV